MSTLKTRIVGLAFLLVPGAVAAQPSGLLFRPVEPCTLLDTATRGSRLGAEVEEIQPGDGEDRKGCAAKVWGEGARSAMVRVEVNDATATTRLKLWTGERAAEPEDGLLAASPAQVGQGLLVMDLCAAPTDSCIGSWWAKLEGGEAEVKVELVGLFERPSVQESTTALASDLEMESAPLSAPYWIENALGNGIHFNEGWVGIGTTVPQTLFQVGSWENADVRMLVGGDMLSLQGIEGKDRLPYFDLRSDDGSRAFYLGWGSKANKVVDWKFENNYKLAIQGGKVGIGTTTPDAVLDVVGNFAVRNIPADDFTPANATINLYSREAGGSKHRWAFHSASVGGGFGVVPNSLTIWEYDGRSCTSPDPICHARMVFEPNTGNVGIGTADPQARLHVAGDLKLDGRLVSNGDICIGACP